jgi:opacity protein-like surface antigen
MNTTTFARVSALCAALVAGAIAPAASQMSIEAEAGPFVGGTVFLSDPSDPFAISRQEASPLAVQDGQLRNGIAVGVHAGLRFAERIGFEGTYAWIPTELSASSGLEAHGGAVDVSAVRYGLASTVHFAPLGRLQPFAGVGVSGETLSYGPHLAWQRRSTFAGSVTLGGNLWLSDGVFLRVGAARDVLTRDDRRPQNQLMVTAGLSARQRIR